MKITVRRPVASSSRRASATASRRSATPELTALIWTNSASICCASSNAIVVLPEPRAGAEQMLLADHLVEARGPDAIGERLRGRLFLREEAPGCGFAPHTST